jgi:hypothetical protein
MNLNDNCGTDVSLIKFCPDVFQPLCFLSNVHCSDLSTSVLRQG